MIFFVNQKGFKKEMQAQAGAGGGEGENPPPPPPPTTDPHLQTRSSHDGFGNRLIMVSESSFMARPSFDKARLQSFKRTHKRNEAGRREANKPKGPTEPKREELPLI